MYREVAKLIIYGNHEDTILMKMSDIFKKFDRDEETPDKLISDIYEQIKRIPGVLPRLKINPTMTRRDDINVGNIVFPENEIFSVLQRGFIAFQCSRCIFLSNQFFDFTIVFLENRD